MRPRPCPNLPKIPRVKIYTHEYTFLIHTFVISLILQLDFKVLSFNSCSGIYQDLKDKSSFCSPTDDESDSDAEEEQEKTVSCTHTHTHPSSETKLSLNYHIIVFIDNY